MRRTIAVIAGLLLGGSYAAAQCTIDPNTLLVDGYNQARYGSATSPRVRWTDPNCTSGTHDDWDIQADSRADFHGCDPDVDPNSLNCQSIWFWNGTNPNKPMKTATVIDWGTGQYPDESGHTDGYRPVDGRLNLTYLRVRIHWNGSWTPWSETQYKLHSVPSAPSGVSISPGQETGSMAFYIYPSLVSGNEYFVDASVANNVQECGPVATPCKTITYLLDPSHHLSFTIQPGDTITVREGTYQEQVDIGSNQPAGNRTNPVTFRADPAAAPGSVIVAGPMSGGPTFTLRVSRDYWRIEGLRFTLNAMASGQTYHVVEVFGAKGTTIDGISFGQTPSDPNVQARIVLAHVRSNDPARSDDTRILNSVFNQKAFDQVEVESARYVEIRGNDFSGLLDPAAPGDPNTYNHVNVQIHGGASEGAIVESNTFHDSTLGGESALMLYLGSGAATVRNNLFYHLYESNPGVAGAIMAMRSGKTVVENNTIYDVPRGITLIDNSRRMFIRNNIISNAHVAAFDFSQSSVCDGCGTAGTILGYNLTWMNQEDFHYAANYDLDPNLIENSSLTGANPEFLTNVLNEDPHFADPDGGDFTIAANSPAKDAGDPGTPVPVGGGTRRDIGAKERGASEPYEYQATFTTTDTHPRISWNFEDPDNWMRFFDSTGLMPPVMAPDPNADFQSDLQIQMDSVPTFDSMNGMHPLRSTNPDGNGVMGPCPGPNCVIFSDNFFEFPDVGGLPPGMYYIRVRTRPRWGDNLLWGAWSDEALRIEITTGQGGGGGGGGGGCNPPKCFPGH